MMQKKLLVVTELFNIITAIDFDAKKPALYNWELVVAEYVENGTHCISIT